MGHSREYPENPIIGIGALIIQDGCVVLVERGREPLKGYWSLPGGALEVGETIEEGLRREVLEETGLQVRSTGLVEVFERIMREPDGRVRYHYVLLDYLCRAAGGVLCAADDCARAEWVARENLNKYRLTEGALPVIEKAFEMACLASD